MMPDHPDLRILVLATEMSAYVGADAVGKAHHHYPTRFYILRVPSPVLLPEDFYLRCFARGIDGILVAAAGSDCPFLGAYERLARRIDKLTRMIKEGGLETQRIRLTAICTVCVKAFLKEVNRLDEAIRKCGPVDRELAERLWRASLDSHALHAASA
jgi:F420-non-reducing hydrogenase iron-sulfur subunit